MSPEKTKAVTDAAMCYEYAKIRLEIAGMHPVPTDAAARVTSRIEYELASSALVEASHALEVAKRSTL